MSVELRLVRESPIDDLLPAGSPDRLEASGVVATGGRYLVIFDNLRAVAVIDEDLDRPAANRLVPTPGRGPGYEDIARDPRTGHLFLLIEAERRNGGWQARVEEYDDRLGFVADGWLEYPVPSGNKGIEGLEVVQRGGQTYLLGLCEGNRDRAGAAGRRPGGGRVVVFRRGRRNWKVEATVDLPETLTFTDYSALSLDGDRLAVVSQESSALWVGRLAPGAWAVPEPGRTYHFPRDAGGGIVYAMVEGVCWLRPERVVAVSDRRKARTPGVKDQSLHLFDLPGRAG